MLDAKMLDGEKFPVNTFTVTSLKRDQTLQQQAMPNNYKSPKNKRSSTNLLMYAWAKHDEAREKEKASMSIVNEIDKAKYIRWLVAHYGGFEVSDPDFLIGKKNGNSGKGYLRYTDCRQAGMFLCDKHTKATRQEITNLFGRKERTTVIHSLKKVQEMLDAQDEFFTGIIQYVEVQLEIKMLSTSRGAKRSSIKL